MKRFASLLSGAGDPGLQQASARAQLPSMLAAINLRLWSPSMPINADGERILIGVAAWSVYDLQLLDRLQAKLACLNRKTIIDIFDVDACRSSDDLERYVPGIGPMFQTPVVGVWRDGAKVSSAWGAAGRKLLAEIGLVE